VGFRDEIQEPIPNEKWPNLIAFTLSLSYSFGCKTWYNVTVCITSKEGNDFGLLSPA
jgi:hypothetical protein